jgi:hypothetical protein
MMASVVEKAIADYQRYKALGLSDEDAGLVVHARHMAGMFEELEHEVETIPYFEHELEGSVNWGLEIGACAENAGTAIYTRTSVGIRRDPVVAIKELVRGLSRTAEAIDELDRRVRQLEAGRQ